MSVDPFDWTGATLAGRYRIERRLADGGMGRVYLARDVQSGEAAVVKAPRPDALDLGAIRDRFAREVHSLRRFAHPNIVRLVDVGDHAGCPFLAMEYCPGGSLRDRQFDADGRAIVPPPARLAEWLAPMAEALDFLHRQGAVHRDVKPDNILFDAQGRALLADFGLAKLLQAPGGGGGRAAQTSAGMILGTPEYLAPEYIMDEPCDGRVDQYALAVAVYELLSGRLPFVASNLAAIMLMQTTKRPKRLDELRKDIPRELADAVQTALAKAPAHRFATCSAFAEAVLRIAATVPGLPFPPPEPEPAAAKVYHLHVCGGCAARLKVPAARLGMRIRCGKCQHVDIAPDDAPLVPGSPEPEPARAAGPGVTRASPSFHGGRSLALMQREAIAPLRPMAEPNDVAAPGRRKSRSKRRARNHWWKLGAAAAAVLAVAFAGIEVAKRWPAPQPVAAPALARVMPEPQKPAPVVPIPVPVPDPPEEPKRETPASAPPSQQVAPPPAIPPPPDGTGEGAGPGVFLDIDYAARPGNAALHFRSENGGVADGRFFHWFPARHGMSGPLIPYRHAAAGEYLLEMRLKLDNITLWCLFGDERHGNYRRHFSMNLTAAGPGELKRERHNLIDPTDKNTGVATVRIRTATKETKNSRFHDCRLKYAGRRIVVEWDGSIVHNDLDRSMEHEGWEPVAGAVTVWPMPNSDRHAMFELKAISLKAP